MSLRPGGDQVERRERAMQLLEKVAEQMGGHIRGYGSWQSGTWTRSSDVDLTLLYAPPVRTEKMQAWECRMLSHLRHFVKEANCTWIGRIFLIRARYSVLKIHGLEGEVLCDVTMNNDSGIKNTALVRALCEELKPLAPLVRVLKYWAHQRRIDERRTGGFSAYTLMLMAAHFLQHFLPKMTISHEKLMSICRDIHNAPCPVAAVAAKAPLPAAPECAPTANPSVYVTSKVLGNFFGYFTAEKFRDGGAVQLVPVEPESEPPLPPASAPPPAPPAEPCAASSEPRPVPEAPRRRPPPPPMQPGISPPSRSAAAGNQQRSFASAPPPPPASARGPVTEPVLCHAQKKPAERPQAPCRPREESMSLPTPPPPPPTPPPELPPVPPPKTAKNLKKQARRKRTPQGPPMLAPLRIYCPLENTDVQRSTKKEWGMLLGELQRASAILNGRKTGEWLFAPRA